MPTNPKLDLKILPMELFDYKEGEPTDAEGMYTYHWCTLKQPLGPYPYGQEFPYIELDHTLGLIALFDMDPYTADDKGIESKPVARFKLHYLPGQPLTEEQWEEFVKDYDSYQEALMVAELDRINELRATEGDIEDDLSD